MNGRAVHDANGDVRIMAYGAAGQAINSISRDGLNCMLLNEASRYQNVSIYFNERCENIDLHKNEIAMHNEKTGATTKRNYNVFFGSDGAFSAARLSLMKTDGMNFT